MRKMASVQLIDSIEPIQDADMIECAVVGGWRVVVKKNEYKAGDKVVYCEIDSWIPDVIAPFLTQPGQFPKVYEGVEGQRLKTKKLRGVISQGLILPCNFTSSFEGKPMEVDVSASDVGADVSEVFGILKWEAPISPQLAGTVKGNFPTLVPKTDQERIQNLKRNFEKWLTENKTWEITEKLEGSSMTCYLPKVGEFEVCSRNLSLKRNDDNTFWKVALKYDIETKMRTLGLLDYAIQGELIGEGVQGNIYNLKGHDFYVYDIYNTNRSVYLSSAERLKIVELLGLKTVPILNMEHKFMRTDSVEFVLLYAEEKSALNQKQEREGVVFKCNEDPSISFKAISNRYLLKSKD